MKSSILFIVVGLHILAFGLTILGGLLYLSSMSSVFPFKFLAITVFVMGAALIVTVLGGRMTWKYTKQIL
jgi:type IV secretory pathway TrbF-like protein